VELALELLSLGKALLGDERLTLELGGTSVVGDTMGERMVKDFPDKPLFFEGTPSPLGLTFITSDTQIREPFAMRLGRFERLYPRMNGQWF